MVKNFNEATYTNFKNLRDNYKFLINSYIYDITDFRLSKNEARACYNLTLTLNNIYLSNLSLYGPNRSEDCFDPAELTKAFKLYNKDSNGGFVRKNSVVDLLYTPISSLI